MLEESLKFGHLVVPAAHVLFFLFLGLMDATHAN